MWSLSRLQIFRFERARLFAVSAGVALTSAVLTGCAERAGPPTDPSSDPLPISEGTASLAAAPAMVQVSAGGPHTCGVTAVGQAYCWGHNEAGQLGNGSTLSSNRPVQVVGGLAFRQISAGTGHTCAVTTENHLYCWGSGVLVGVAPPPSGIETEPALIVPALRFQSVSAGANHTCAVTVGDRRAYCWGFNDFGGLGDGTTSYRATPVRVSGSHAWRHVSAGNLFTCGITTANVASCWGTDRRGNLGDGATEQRKLRPAVVAGDHRFIQIGSGESHTCAVTTARRAWCWGDGSFGSIGDGKTLDRFTPRAVAGGHTFDRVSAGGSHTCAESTTNQTYCWGWNAFGQVGNGTSGFQGVTRPSLVVGGFHFVQVDAGVDLACGRTSGAVVRCWGSNSSGQLGDGTTTHRSTPTLVVGE